MFLIKNIVSRFIPTRGKTLQNEDIYSRHFPQQPIETFTEEELGKFPLEYLQLLKCEDLSNIYHKLPTEYRKDEVIIEKSFRCHDHWPTEGDVPDCPPPFRINCYQCILSKIPQKSKKVEDLIWKHLFSSGYFSRFGDDEIKLFPLFYLMYNVNGECLLNRWSAISEEYRKNKILLSKLPCLKHSYKNCYKKIFIYKYECIRCLYKN